MSSEIPTQSVVTKDDLDMVRSCLGDNSAQLTCLACKKVLPVGSGFLRIPDGDHENDKGCPDSAFCDWDCYNAQTAQAVSRDEEA